MMRKIRIIVMQDNMSLQKLFALIGALVGILIGLAITAKTELSATQENDNDRIFQTGNNSDDSAESVPGTQGTSS